MKKSKKILGCMPEGKIKHVETKKAAPDSEALEKLKALRGK